MYNILFIHYSINGHLDCFHVLTIINSTAVKFGVKCLLNYGFLRMYAQ